MIQIKEDMLLFVMATWIRFSIILIGDGTAEVMVTSALLLQTLTP